MTDSRVVAVISDDEEDEQQQEEEVDEVGEEDVEEPDWLPDGWSMEVYRTDDATINKYYISPVSGRTFTTESEVLECLFKGRDERILQAKEAAEENPFLRKHEGLPKGCLLEIRAGGKNMDKMFKFFVQPKTGVRLQSKEDVLLYTKEKNISPCVTHGECDIKSRNNILANVELNPDGLPKGWVREDVFRKTTGVQKFPYYTDPVNHCTFRTIKSAIHYAETGEITKPYVCVLNQKIGVYDLYSFDKSADLHESLRKRLNRLLVNDGQEAGLSPIDEDDASQLDLQEHDEETSTEAKGDKVRNDLQQETI